MVSLRSLGRPSVVNRWLRARNVFPEIDSLHMESSPEIDTPREFLVAHFLDTLNGTGVLSDLPPGAWGSYRCWPG